MLNVVEELIENRVWYKKKKIRIKKCIKIIFCGEDKLIIVEKVYIIRSRCINCEF